MQSVSGAAASGDRRKALEAMRDTLAEAMDRALAEGPGVLAQLSGQLRAVLADLDALTVPEARSVADELRSRREGRRSAAKVVEGTGGAG